MASELEKGMAFMASYEPTEPDTVGRRNTGEIRWNGTVLEREVEIMHYHNDRPNHAEYVWEPVPQVAHDEARIIAEDAHTVTIHVPSDGSAPMFEDANGNPVTEQEAEDIVRRHYDPEPGEHAEVLAAWEGHNSGDEE